MVLDEVDYVNGLGFYEDDCEFRGDEKIMMEWLLVFLWNFDDSFVEVDINVNE